MGKPKIKSWAKMRKALREKYLPSYYLQETITHFQNLKQGGRTVEEYAGEFEELMMKCEMREDEPHIWFDFWADWIPKSLT